MLKSSYISPLWIITLLSLIGGGYYSYQWWKNQGPEITIEFKDVTGIVPGQTGLYFQGVKIGKVNTIDIDSHNKIAVSVRVNRSISTKLGEESRFWITKPEISLAGVKNLASIASGSSIQVELATGKVSTAFTGLESTPLAPELEKGLRIIVKAQELASIVVGSPVVYRDHKVGAVTEIDIEVHANSVYITVHVFEKYKNLVRNQTVFWNAGELHVNISIFGHSSVDVPSLGALMAGKLSFANQTADKPAVEGQVFTISDSEPDNHKIWQPNISWKENP